MIAFVFQDIWDNIQRYIKTHFVDQFLLEPLLNPGGLNVHPLPSSTQRIFHPYSSFFFNGPPDFDDRNASDMLIAGTSESPAQTISNLCRRSSKTTDMLPFEGENNIVIGFKNIGKHEFCPIPLDADTFCDVCNWPICNLGDDWGPSCLRCADCHMTCHPRCLTNLQVTCHGKYEDKTKVIRSRPTPQEAVRNGHMNTEVEELGIKLDQLSLNSRNETTINGGTSLDEPSRPDERSNGCVLMPSSPKANSDQRRHSPLKAKPDLLNNTDTAEALETGSSNEVVPSVEANRSPDPNQTMYYTARSDLSRFSGRRTTSHPDFAQLPTGLEKEVSPHLFRESLNSDISKPPLPKGRRASRYPSEVNLRSKPRSTNLKARHSFLAGHDATISSRLFYDFSSLDREAIKANNIRVRELIPDLQQRVTPSAPQPSPPSERKNVAEFSCSVIPDSSVSSRSSEVGYATVMQSTTAAIKTRIKRTKQSGFSPAPAIPLTPMTVGPRGRLPYTAAQLAERLEVFNANKFGLQSRMVPSLPAGDCEGHVRIHINLLRPIHMLLTVRPVSIFDLVGKEDEDDTGDADPDEFITPTESGPKNPAGCEAIKPTSVSGNRPVDNVHFFPPKSAVTAGAPPFSSDCPVPSVQRRISKRLFGPHPQSFTFWLPRGDTKLLYVRLSTTTKEVITTLLHRFQIEDNPQKFALYEHTIEGDQEVTVRKLFDDESPLGLLLSWTEAGPEQFNQMLGVKRLVLQENETGDIEWSGFSLSELQTFLRILNQEEADYRRRLELKYELRQKEVIRLMRLYECRNNASQSNDSESTSTVNSATPTLVLRETNHGDGTILNGAPTPAQRSTFEFTDSLSVPIPPVLRVRDQPATEQPDDLRANGPLCAISTTTTPSHSPERRAPTTASTLPRLPSTEDKGFGTLFKPSAYKQMKKAEKAQKKQLARLEKDRVKAEKKRLKAEAKLTQQQKQQLEQHHPHPRRLFGFSGLSSSSSPPSGPPNTRSTLKH